MSEYKLTKGKLRIATDVEPELAKQLEALSDKEDRTLGNMVRVLIREALENRKVSA